MEFSLTLVLLFVHFSDLFSHFDCTYVYEFMQLFLTFLKTFALHLNDTVVVMFAH